LRGTPRAGGSRRLLEAGELPLLKMTLDILYQARDYRK
jgi:hypothetical protein